MKLFLRVAVSRHHQVMVVCPWPAGIEPPGAEGSAEQPELPENSSDLVNMLRRVHRQRFHSAYRRLRRAFGRMGVQVLSAASGEPVELVLARMDRLRRAGRKR